MSPASIGGTEMGPPPPPPGRAAAPAIHRTPSASSAAGAPPASASASASASTAPSHADSSSTPNPNLVSTSATAIQAHEAGGSGRIGACGHCRSKKIKCSGDHPTCVVCAKHNLACVYPEHQSRRRKDKLLSKGDGAGAGSGSGVMGVQRGLQVDDAYGPHGLSSHPHMQRDSIGLSGGQGDEWNIDDDLLGGGDARSSSHFNVDLGVGSTGTNMPTSMIDLPPLNPADVLSQWHFSPQNINLSGGGAQHGISIGEGVGNGNGHGSGNGSGSVNGGGIGDAGVSLEQIFGADPFFDLSFLNGPLPGDGVQGVDGPTTGGPIGTGQEIDWAALGLNMENGNSPSTGTGGKGERRGIPSKFRVPYFSGPTAVASGYRSVIAAMSRPASPSLRAMRLGETDIMDPKGEYPSEAAIFELIPLFHLHFGYAFPSIRISTSSHLSYAPHLINAICALAARYSTFHRPLSSSSASASASANATEDPSASAAAHTWATKAKQQVSLQLAVPSLDTVETLLILSWVEFGQDRDSGLWMYSGMAVRMGQDLGLDPNLAQSAGDLAEGGDETRRLYLLTSLYMLDSILTMGTGRFGIYSVPAESFAITYPELVSVNGNLLPHPFTYILKAFILVSRMTRVLLAPIGNGNGNGEGPESVSASAGAGLAKVQMALDAFIGELPPALRFDTASFQAYAAVGQGGAFALLHVWLHATIIFAFEPSITSDEIIDDVPPANKLISASSAKTILDIAVFAELIDPKAITQPWIGYPLYVAGRTFLSHSRPLDASGPSQHMARQSRASCQKCIDILSVPMSKWAGVRYLRVALQQKGRGVIRLDLGSSDAEGTSTGEGGQPDGSPEVMPDKLSEWLASSRHGDDVVGLSMAGSFNSPSGNRVDLIARAR